MDRLDVGAERIALMLGPDSVLAIARYVGKPAAAWTGDHAAHFYRTSFGTNRTRPRISSGLHRTSVVRLSWSAASPTSWCAARR